MILFTNGCSHTAGVCVLPPLTWPWMLTRSLIDEEWKTPINEIENNPQDYISKDENQLIDYSDHGKSNDLIYYETLHFLLSLQKKGLKPDFVVDISDHFQTKINAVKAYKSQFYNPDETVHNTPISSKNFLDSIEYRARDLGRLTNVDYAEGFISARLPLVDSISTLK